MNKTAIKIFLCFTMTAAVTAIVLLCINLFNLSYIGSDSRNNYERSPKKILSSISTNLVRTEDSFLLTEPVELPADSWCILIGENGDILWSLNQPSDIPTHYTLNDIARMTKWYLNDYPVYVRTESYGLLVVGMPKNSVGKYDLEYSMAWFSALPERILTIFMVNLLLAAILACVFGFRLFVRLREVTYGIKCLRLDKPVHLNETGLFKELFQSINEASSALSRKNAALAEKDSARLNWISGISHDIRTPLSIVMGNAEALGDSAALSTDEKEKAGRILTQSIRIKKLIEDLNLISSLEYDMQPAKKKAVRLCPLLRHITSEILNSGLADCFSIELELKNEKTVISVDEALLERAFYNLLQNSMMHNPAGCIIKVQEVTDADSVFIIFSDNGSGVPDEVMKKMNEIPKTAHGLGLPMAYKIVSVHGGKIQAWNENGFHVKITFPLEN